MRATDKSALWILAGCFLVAHVLFAVVPSVFVAWNDRVTDRLFALREVVGRAPASSGEVAHLNFGDASAEALGTFHPDRGAYAEVMRNLSRVGVAAQVWDYAFVVPDDLPLDAELTAAAEEAGNVQLGMFFQRLSPQRDDGESPGDTLLQSTAWPTAVPEGGVQQWGLHPQFSFPELATAAAGNGFLNVAPDGDGVLRRVPLFVRTTDGLYPGLALRTFCDVRGIDPRSIVVAGRSVRLPGAGAEGADLVVPIDRTGALRVNFGGAWRNAGNHYPLHEILALSKRRADLPLWQEMLGNRIVVIGDVSTASRDIGAVPTDPLYPLVGVHATVLDNLLTARFLRELSGLPMVSLELLLLTGLALLGRLPAVRFVAGALAVIVGYLVLAIGAFVMLAVILNLVRPLLMLGFGLLSIAAYRYHVEQTSRVVLQSSFEAYFSPEVVHKVMRDPEALDRASSEKTLTVLFSDLVAFTRLCEELPAQTVREFLNDYFGEMSQVVFRYGGTVDKFLGDGMMVFFGDPVAQDDHTLRCVEASVEMQRRMASIRERWQSSHGLAPELRIGIHRGPVIVGNLGSRRRRTYTAIGRNVNLAKRLESCAPPGGILLSEQARAEVEGRIETRYQGEEQLKGIAAPVATFRVVVETSGDEADAAPLVVPGTGERGSRP